MTYLDVVSELEHEGLVNQPDFGDPIRDAQVNLSAALTTVALTPGPSPLAGSGEVEMTVPPEPEGEGWRVYLVAG